MCSCVSQAVFCFVWMTQSLLKSLGVSIGYGKRSTVTIALKNSVLSNYVGAYRMLGRILWAPAIAQRMVMSIRCCCYGLYQWRHSVAELFFRQAAMYSALSRKVMVTGWWVPVSPGTGIG
ncbi:hypothetical protein D3C87_1569350 [compost metagenome]